MVSFNMGLAIGLDLPTVFMAIRFLVTTISCTITAVSFSVLTSWPSDFLIGGTPTIITDILTITPTMMTRRSMTTGIGTVYRPRSKQHSPDAVIIMGRLTA